MKAALSSGKGGSDGAVGSAVGDGAGAEHRTPGGVRAAFPGRLAYGS